MSKSLPLRVFKEVVGGNTNDAEVLKEIWHGVSYARAQEGRDWYALSRDAISGSTGLSLDKVERSLSRVRKAALITSEQHLFGGRNVNHYRVTDAAVEAVVAAASGQQLAVPVSCKSAVPVSCKVAVPVSCKVAVIYSTASSTASPTAISTGGTIPNGIIPQEGLTPKTEDAGKAVEEESSKEKIHPKKKNHVEPEMGKMADVEALVKAKKKMHKPDTVASLEKLWINVVFEEQGSMVVITKKHRGQLAMLLNRWEKPDDVMAHVLAGWTYFAAKVATDAGVKDTPAYPNLDFLLKHASIAGIFAEPKKPMVHEAPKATGLIKAIPVQSIANAHVEATLAEVLAINKEIKNNG